MASAIAGRNPMNGRMPPARFISCCRSEPPAPMTMAARMAIVTIDRSMPATSMTSVCAERQHADHRSLEKDDGEIGRLDEAAAGDEGRDDDEGDEDQQDGVLLNELLPPLDGVAGGLGVAGDGHVRPRTIRRLAARWRRMLRPTATMMTAARRMFW